MREGKGNPCRLDAEALGRLITQEPEGFLFHIQQYLDRRRWHALVMLRGLGEDGMSPEECAAYLRRRCERLEDAARIRAAAGG